MKKIERSEYKINGASNSGYIIVKDTDLDELEQQRDELLTLLIEMYDPLILLMQLYSDWKYIDYYADCVKDMVEKITGKTLEEIKAGKDE